MNQTPRVVCSATAATAAGSLPAWAGDLHQQLGSKLSLTAGLALLLSGSSLAKFNRILCSTTVMAATELPAWAGELREKLGAKMDVTLAIVMFLAGGSIIDYHARDTNQRVEKLSDEMKVNNVSIQEVKMSLAVLTQKFDAIVAGFGGEGSPRGKGTDKKQ